MRMRKKTNLKPRMEKCAKLLVNDPENNKGKWLEEIPGYKSIYLELGCGKGTFTVNTAKENPDVLYIALEIVPDAMVMAMEKAMDMELSNVRFIDGDAMNVKAMFGDEELERIYINFCDPWPKSHDAKHRLTAPIFTRKYADVLKIGGQIHFKTDNDPLFNWSKGMLEEEGWVISELTNDLHKFGVNGIMTDYETKFYNEGITINRLVATKSEGTKDKRAGEAPRMYNAGIERPYRTSELFNKQEEDEN